MMSEIMARASGSTYPEISQRDFKPLPIAVPHPEVNDGFIDRVAPLFDRIEVNTVESDKLAETRDYLLPKLISGEIRVDAAEEVAKAAA